MAPEEKNDSASGNAGVAETETTNGNGTNGVASSEPKRSYLNKMKMSKGGKA